jgi:hypothetical protein
LIGKEIATEHYCLLHERKAGQRTT